MKRIFGVLALALVFFSACKKEDKGKDKDTTPVEETPLFNESDLIGYWACYESVEQNGTVTQSPPYAFAAYSDHTFQYSSEIIHSPCTWEIDGDDLSVEIDGVKKTTLTQLDGKHLTLKQDWHGDVYTDSYINISRILPGTWKISLPGTTYIVEIEDNGHSSWLREGTTDVVYYDWTLDLNTGRVVVCFGDEGSDWYNPLTLKSVSDDHFEAKNKNDSTVTLERQ